jgi:thiamine-triphosphatase
MFQIALRCCVLTILCSLSIRNPEVVDSFRMGLLYEVERKFVFNRALLTQFHSNRGRPPFHSLIHQGNSTFRDTYFDSSEILANKGIWLRKRDQSWEAKINIRNSFVKAAYDEITSIPEIRGIVSKYVPCASTFCENQDFGLQAFCDFTTYRSTYVADKKFNVVLDTTDFGHVVGEVEMMASDVDKAERDIDEFFARYSWFFQGGKPKGKIAAYLEMKRVGGL